MQKLPRSLRHLFPGMRRRSIHNATLPLPLVYFRSHSNFTTKHAKGLIVVSLVCRCFLAFFPGGFKSRLLGGAVGGAGSEVITTTTTTTTSLPMSSWSCPSSYEYSSGSSIWREYQGCRLHLSLTLILGLYSLVLAYVLFRIPRSSNDGNSTSSSGSTTSSTREKDSMSSSKRKTRVSG